MPLLHCLSTVFSYSSGIGPCVCQMSPYHNLTPEGQPASHLNPTITHVSNQLQRIRVLPGDRSCRLDLQELWLRCPELPLHCPGLHWSEPGDLFGMALGLVAGLQFWVGQSGVLASWGVITYATLGPLWHLTSICHLGITCSELQFKVFNTKGQKSCQWHS